MDFFDSPLPLTEALDYFRRKELFPAPLGANLLLSVPRSHQ